MLKVRLILIALTLIASGAHANDVAEQTPKTKIPANKPEPRPLPDELKDVKSLIFVQRAKYEDNHWYANIGYYCQDEKPAYASGAQLCKLDIASGKATVLLDAGTGCIRDPQVHYDGKKLVFAWRKADTRHYDLYEMNIDGSGICQLTTGPYDDYEPSYLPDGGIVFVSTRCRRWVQCWLTQVGTIHRCDADGSNIRMLSCNIEHDNTPAVLPDGRILYMRWEYVDRSQVEFHHLWTMNPDGSNQAIYYGNERPWGVFLGARPIPGSDRVIGIYSGGHGRNEHFGDLTFWTSRFGPDDPKGQEKLPFEERTSAMADPWPLSENCILAVNQKHPEIVLVEKNTVSGKYVCRNLYSLPADKNKWLVQEPRPVIARPRERIMPDKARLDSAVGHHILIDVYNSQNMEGVKRGEIKKLLILETLPKPVNFSGGMDMISAWGTFTLERILGTVPVEEDGSAFFELPANRPVLYVALDKDNLSVKRMQSFTSVIPGEVNSCLGCHEKRQAAPPSQAVPQDVAAVKRGPSKITPLPGVPDVPDFIRDVQPVLDKHCVKCHNPEKHSGGLSLAADMGPQYSISYWSLIFRNQVADGRNGHGNRPPRSTGSSASPLLRKMEGGHHDVKVPKEDWLKVWAWLEAAAPFCGTYGGLRNEDDRKIPYHAFNQKARSVINRRCASCHSKGGTAHEIPAKYDAKAREKACKRPHGRHERFVWKNDPVARFSTDVLLNTTRPEKSSLLLAPLAKKAGGRESCGVVFESKDDQDYQAILSGLQAFKDEWMKLPRFGTPNFEVNRQYIREMVRFGVLPAGTQAEKVDAYETDRKYWDLFDLTKSGAGSK